MARSCEIARRHVLLVAAAAAGAGGRRARADDDAPGSDERPRKADLLVFGAGDRAGQVIRAADLRLGAAPVEAWPMDPVSKVVRSGSRLNSLLLLRVDPAECDDDTREHAADGVVAYSAVCTHAGCPITGWVEDGGRSVLKCFCHNSEYDPRQNGTVVFGPAPRHLTALPLATVNDTLTVAGPFLGRIGPQQMG